MKGFNVVEGAFLIASGISFLLANPMHHVQTVGISAVGIYRGEGPQGKTDSLHGRRLPF